MHRRFNNARTRPAREERSHPSFATRAAIAIGLSVLAVALLWLAYRAITIVLLCFAGVVMAAFLHSISAPVSRWTRLPLWVTVLVVVTLLVSGIAMVGWLLAPSVSHQFQELGVQLPLAWNRLLAQLQSFEWFNWLVSQESAPSNQSVLAQIPRIFTITAGVIAAVVIIVFLAIFIAAQPAIYLDGVVRLLPVKVRPRAREVCANVYRTLRIWLLTKLLTMTLTGVGIGVGVWLLDVPLALALGVLAGILEFIPTIGPLISIVPALLLALVKSPMTALYVALLYFVVQWVGNHVTTPLLQHKTLSLPPAVTLIMVALLGALFGFPGALMSGPLSVVAFVLIKMVYVEDVLERRGHRPVQSRPAHRVTAEVVP